MNSLLSPLESPPPPPPPLPTARADATVATSPESNAAISPTAGLLDCLREFLASVGSGLNDAEITQLLRRMPLPVEAGFRFVCFAEGVATFGVPPQDPADWYPPRGWLRKSKEILARTIADRHGLTISEPPDELMNVYFLAADPPPCHHHLEFTRDMETVVVIHPRYLKIRLLGTVQHVPFVSARRTPVVLPPELMTDLAGLYRGPRRVHLAPGSTTPPPALA